MKSLKNTLSFLLIIFILNFKYINAHPLSDDFADLVAKKSPSVVNVFTVQKPKQPTNNQDPLDGIPPQFRDFFKNFPPGFPFGPPQQSPNQQESERPQALGSGFVIDPTGYIVTNNHVIEQANEIKVKFQDDTELEAKLVGTDKLTDIALLKVESKKPLPYLKFADSDKARVGHSVFAIGNPFGLGGTVTSGIISAFNRDINAGPYDSFIQTDASINRGNSGGPLFNLDGEVLGINTAIFSPTGGSVGIGFSIPSNLAKPIIEQLRKFGKTQRGWLGVRIQELTPEIAKSLGLNNEEGVLISMVNPGEPAEKGGLKSGDVIIEFNGKKIKDVKSLQRTVAESAVESKAKVKVWRDKKAQSFTVQLGELEKFNTTKDDSAETNKDVVSDEVEIDKIGLRLLGLNKETRAKYDIAKSVNGVVITAVKRDSFAAKAGLNVGNVISQIAQKDIKMPEQAKEIFEEFLKKKSDSALLQVFEGEFSRFLILKLK
ncbi:MAG: DegQ family serine endoprotease [Alphaproteobacteria bacterium]